MTKTIKILQLYPRDMNIYGDWGNTLVLKRRLEWYGYAVELLEYNVGDEFPKNIDLIVGGGGQDSGQEKIQKDLLKIGPQLKKLARDNVPMLVVCGLYQLFGRYFRMQNGKILQGIGIFNAETVGGPKRMIGNVALSSEQFGLIVGYENHSGATNLDPGVRPLGKIIRGDGNNGHDKTEGARFHNVIGTYLHGSLLPKNPEIADWLIRQAVEQKFGEFDPKVIIDDTFAKEARDVAARLSR